MRLTKKARMQRVAMMVTLCADKAADPECIITDFLADLAQWCEAHDYDAEVLFARAMRQMDEMWEYYA